MTERCNCQCCERGVGGVFLAARLRKEKQCNAEGRDTGTGPGGAQANKKRENQKARGGKEWFRKMSASLGGGSMILAVNILRENFW